MPGIVGRTEELAVLGQHVDALEQRAPTVLALAGEPGIGKSRLLAELCEVADARGCLVLDGRAAELERDLPFGVFVDALDDYVDSRGADGLPAEAGGILPSLAGAGLGILQAERHRSHQALRSLLELLADPTPLVLALDDLHWADEASLELLGYLLRRRPRGSVLLALAFRPHQAPPQLAAALAVAARAGAFTRLELGPLSPQAAEELLGERVDPDLYRESGGNPFYLEQLARSEAREGNGNGVGEVPREVVAALRGELGRLSEGARSLLEGAAVAGDPFEFELGAAGPELDPDAALAALDELADRGLVRTTTVPRRFRFRHPIVRRAVYEGMRPGRRLALHARLADGLEARGAGAIARAHHVERSAQAGDERAIATLTEAGRAAEATAPASAAHWYAAALRLVPSDDDARRVELLTPMATALASAGHLEESRAAVLEAIDELPRDARTERTRLTAQCAAVEQLLGRRADARERLTRALSALPISPCPQGCELQIELAVDGLWKSDFDGAKREAESALRLARDLERPALEALSAAVGSLGGYCTGRLADAEAHRATAATILDEMSDEQLSERLDGSYYLGWADFFLERQDEAIDHLERGIRVARATAKGQFLVPMLVGRAWALRARGRLDEAVWDAQAAVDAARLSSAQLLSWALMGHCWAVLPTGDLTAAMASGAEAAAIANSVEPSVWTRAAHGHLAAAYVEAGEVDRCFAHMEAAGAPDFPLVESGRRCIYYEVLTRAELLRGRTEAAAAWAARAETVRGGAPPVTAACADWARARVLLATGDAAGAAHLAARAVGAGTVVPVDPAATAGTLPADSAARAGTVMPINTARSRILAGRALAAGGDPEAAVRELERAEGELAALGAWHYRDEAVRALRKLGVRVARPGRRADGEVGIDALSERERQIAELVADGQTNKQIGARLFLSTRTVERHLSHVFRKLDVSSRAQVGALLQRDAG